MELTIGVIEQNIDKAIGIIKEVYPQFNYLGFGRIKISRSRTTHACVTFNRRTNTFEELTVSNIFNEFKDDNVAKEKLLVTLVHELLHTIPGCQDHKGKWKALAGLVNKKHPFFNIGRTDNFYPYLKNEEFTKVMKTKEATWRLRCPECGKVYDYTRKSKYGGAYECGVCHTHPMVVEHFVNGKWVNA